MRSLALIYLAQVLRSFFALFIARFLKLERALRILRLRKSLRIVRPRRMNNVLIRRLFVHDFGLVTVNFCLLARAHGLLLHNHQHFGSCSCILAALACFGLIEVCVVDILVDRAHRQGVCVLVHRVWLRHIVMGLNKVSVVATFFLWPGSSLKILRL